MRNEESSAFQRPFFHSPPRKTTYILFVSRVVTKRNFLGPIRSFDIVNWVNLSNPPRDLRSVSRGETSRFDPCPIFCRGYRGDLNPARDLLRVDRRLELDQRVSHVRYQDAISMSRFRCLFPLLAIDPGTGDVHSSVWKYQRSII